MANKKVTQKKAQIIGQVMMFVLAALVFIIVLTYGYSAIKKFLETGEELNIAEFQNTFANAVENIKRDYGSTTKIDLSVPPKYTTICIADSDSTIQNDDFMNDKKLQRIYHAWKTGTQNVFFVPPSAQQLKKINDITIDDNGKPYFCTQNKGKLSLKLEGTGDRAKVSIWQQ